MSTGSTGNGLSAPNAYPAVTRTFVPGDQVLSATLNAIQTGILNTSSGLDSLAGLVGAHRSSTRNQAESPAPTTSGGLMVWVEAVTSGTAVVVLDTSIDYRDRFIIVVGTTLPEPLFTLARPGGASDTGCDAQLSGTGSLFDFSYLEQGQAGGSSGPGIEVAGARLLGTDKLRIFARSADGALCMAKDGTTDAEIGTIFLVFVSPMQNHY